MTTLTIVLIVGGRKPHGVVLWLRMEQFALRRLCIPHRKEDLSSPACGRSHDLYFDGLLASNSVGRFSRTLGTVCAVHLSPLRQLRRAASWLQKAICRAVRHEGEVGYPRALTHCLTVKWGNLANVCRSNSLVIVQRTNARGAWIEKQLHVFLVSMKLSSCCPAGPAMRKACRGHGPRHPRA
jgi:hypothetical protein